jgi:hypothetical protein
MDIDILLKQLWDRDVLQYLSLKKIIAFISQASALKRDIMQPQSLAVPSDHAPDILPPFVSEFLSDSLDIPPLYMMECWEIFKGVIWDHPSAEELKRAGKEAFKVHGQKCGLSKFMLEDSDCTAWYLTVESLQRPRQSTLARIAVSTCCVQDQQRHCH